MPKKERDGVHLYYKGALVTSSKIATGRDSLLARMEFRVRYDGVVAAEQMPGVITCIARLPIGSNFHSDVIEISDWKGTFTDRLPFNDLAEFAEACIREQIGQNGTHLQIAPDVENITLEDCYFEGSGRSAFIPFTEQDDAGW